MSQIIAIGIAIAIGRSNLWLQFDTDAESDTDADSDTDSDTYSENISQDAL